MKDVVLYPPEYATGWKGGREGREGGGVLGRPHFEGASLSSRVFSNQMSWIRIRDPGVKPDPDSDPDPEKFKIRIRIRIRIQAKSLDPTGYGSRYGSGSATLDLIVHYI